VLVASVARLSASVRDRRLAVLRLLGLAPGRTRVVAAVESGAGAAAGSVLGLAAFWATRPVLSQLQVAGRDWAGTSFTPWPLATLAVVAGLPAVAVAVALVPTRGLRRDMLPASRLDAGRRPSPWRLLPLAVGLALTMVDLSSGQNVSDAQFAAFLAGAVLCGVGALLVLPVLTRLLADLLVRVPESPALLMAGRRLQTQPAGVSRVLAGLLIGLFLVTGGRMVVGAFENTSTYVGAELAIEGGHALYGVSLPLRADPDAAVETLGAVDGARGAYVDRRLQTSCPRAEPCLTAFVGSCADLAVALPVSTGCDGTAAWLGDAEELAASGTAELVWRGHGQQLSLPRPETRIAVPTAFDADLAKLHVFLPASTPGVLDLVAPAGADVVVALDLEQVTQRDLRAAAADLAPRARTHPLFWLDEYEFVAGLRALVWAVAAVVLAVGLLGFAVTAVDRALVRRAEMVSLQLVGTPGGCSGRRSGGRRQCHSSSACCSRCCWAGRSAAATSRSGARWRRGRGSRCSGWSGSAQPPGWSPRG